MILPHSRHAMLEFLSPRPMPNLFRHGVFVQIRLSSSKRWQARQHKDQFSREAAVQGLKSRAAFKLLQVAHLAEIGHCKR